MGYALDDVAPKRLPPLKEISVNNNKPLNQELESKIESSLVLTLQAKCTELGREVEEDKALRKQAEVENSMLKSHLLNMEQEIRQLQVNLIDERNDKMRIDEHLDKVTEMLNKSNREVGRLKQELKVSNDAAEQAKQQMIKVNREKEDEGREYEAEIDRLRSHLGKLEEELDESRSKHTVKMEIGARVDEERTRYLKEMETKSVAEIEAKLEKINRLIGENATLTERLSESERIRRRYQERHAADENTIKNLSEKTQYLEGSVSSLKKQLNDAKSLKSNNHKIYEEKISGLNDQVEKQKKEIARLKKMQNSFSPNPKINDEEPEEVLEPVKAKPYLFGPVDSGKF